MANKSSREQRVKQNRRKIYEQLCERLNIFYYIALGFSVLILLLFFCPWTQNYNYSLGVQEQALNGWQYFAAGISGKYDTAGNLGDFFIKYAESYTRTLAILTLISVILLVLIIAMLIVTVVTKKHELSFATIFLGFLFEILLITSCVVAFSMKNSNIYIIYCDPKQCEMRSYIIIPIIVTLGLLALNIVAIAKYFSARKYLK